MAVQSIDYQRYSQRGSDGADKYELAVIAKVTMDAGDGVVTALSAPGLPAKGSTYNHFGETHPATLRTIGVQRVHKNTPSKSIVNLILNYEQEQPEQKDPSGGPTSNPEDVQAILTPGYRFATEYIENAEFIEFVDANGDTVVGGGTAVLRPGYRGPMVNAANVPYLPVPEQEIAWPTLTLEKYYRRWSNLFDEAVLNTNDADYRIIFPDGSGTIVYDRAFARGELLLQNITATQRQFGNQIWYWLRFEFWIGTWTRDLLNAGFAQRETAFGTDPKLRPILNEAGELVESPVNLDASGFVAADGATPIYTRWKTRNEFPFDLLGLTN